VNNKEQNMDPVEFVMHWSEKLGSALAVVLGLVFVLSWPLMGVLAVIG